MAGPPAAPRARCLCLDIETTRGDRLVLRELGVFRPDLDLRRKLSGKASDLASRLDALTEGAAFVLGHNVIPFDQPALAALHPELALHRLPLIDTLELSPVAFPQNPYHRLVKDYKLCTTTRNDPVRDAELAYALFVEQSEALQQRVREHLARLGGGGDEVGVQPPPRRTGSAGQKSMPLHRDTARSARRSPGELRCR